MIARFFIAIGASLVVFVRYLGEVVLLAADTFRSAFTHRLRWRLFLQQIVEIGLLSQVVVIVTGGFTGAGSGFTSRIITTPDADIAEDKVVTNSGSYNATATCSAAWVMQMIAFK